MRQRILVGSLVAAVALFGVACDSDEPDDEPEASSSETVDTDVSPSGDFDTSLVEQVSESEDGSAVVVYLIVPDIDEEPTLLQECTTAYGSEDGPVACYAFDSEEAFEAAEVAEDGSSMRYECWTAFFAVDENGAGRGELENSRYDEENCS